jgi:hypothetical protein
MEHRCGYRRAVDVSAMVRTRGGLVAKATLCEVSASGARLQVSLPLAVQSVVLVQFVIHGQGRQSQRATIEAEVVRPTQAGFAVERTEFAPEAARALSASLIQTNMDPARDRIRNAAECPGCKHRFVTGRIQSRNTICCNHARSLTTGARRS